MTVEIAPSRLDIIKEKIQDFSSLSYEDLLDIRGCNKHVTDHIMPYILWNTLVRLGQLYTAEKGHYHSADSAKKYWDIFGFQLRPYAERGQFLYLLKIFSKLKFRDYEHAKYLLVLENESREDFGFYYYFPNLVRYACMNYLHCDMDDALPSYGGYSLNVGLELLKAFPVYAEKIIKEIHEGKTQFYDALPHYHAMYREDMRGLDHCLREISLDEGLKWIMIYHITKSRLIRIDQSENEII